ncbi:MAG TPA: asparagine synthase (glutamine-hydrolyzing) [Gemmatimonadaceae bacterium]|nr:asparagine synthase (glutamine-hydrolyzing) [Gemmatimonadaceae bacterium]
MCGIAGRYGVAPLEVAEADELANSFQTALRARGPNGWQHHHDSDLVLVHRRLAIIDLSAAAAQPLWNEDQTICVIANGEVYNHRELREQLTRQGHRFRSRSDSEIIVHLYEQHGIDACCAALEGMFAFALWDSRSRDLYLVRDRLGIKPLVLAEHDHGVSFASTLPALLCDADVPRVLREEAFVALLKWGFVPSPWSAVRAARRLDPGSWIRIRAGRVREEHAWWSDLPTDRDATEADVRRAIERAVDGHLVSDVPIGVLLSAGIDSGIVAGLARRLQAEPTLQAWTVRHAGFVDDEYPGAMQAAACFGLPCTAVDVGDAGLTEERFDNIIAAMDEPLAVSSLVGLHGLFREIAPSRRVILTGDGGDELFAGYSWHAGMPAVPSWARGARFARVAPVLAGLSNLPGRAGSFGKVAARVRREPSMVYLDKLRTTRDDVLEHLGIAAIQNDPMELRAAAAWNRFAANGTLEQMLAVDRGTALVDEMLAKLDTAAMAYGIEARVPLLADQVVQVAKRTREDLKWAGDRGKIVLRNWYARLGPKGLSARRKTGFNSPVGKWFEGERGEFLREHVRASLGFFDASADGSNLTPGTHMALAVADAWRIRVSAIPPVRAQLMQR